jgi:hypothetical protein
MQEEEREKGERVEKVAHASSSLLSQSSIVATSL